MGDVIIGASVSDRHTCGASVKLYICVRLNLLTLLWEEP